MDTEMKEWRTDPKRLVRIPLDSDESYIDWKEYLFDQFEGFEKYGSKPEEAVNTLFYHDVDNLPENGLIRVIMIIRAILYKTSRDAVDGPAAYEAMCDADDILSGDYDDILPVDGGLLKTDASRC